MKWKVLAGVLLLMTRTLLQAAESTAVYDGLNNNQFMKRWLVLSPIPVSTEASPDETTQEKAFATDYVATTVQPKAGETTQIDGKEYRWRLVDSHDDVIDPSVKDAPAEFVSAYAWAQINMAQSARMLFGIGSDDAVRVWLN